MVYLCQMQYSQPQASPSSSGHPPNRASSNKILLLVLIGVVSLLLVVGIIFGLVFILRDDDAADETGNSETSESEETSDNNNGDDEEGGDSTTDRDDDEENPAISEPSRSNNGLTNNDVEDELQVFADKLRQVRQETLDALEEAGIEEYELQGFFNGVDDVVYIVENNSSRFALLSEEKYSASIRNITQALRPIGKQLFNAIPSMPMMRKQDGDAAKMLSIAGARN